MLKDVGIDISKMIARADDLREKAETAADKATADLYRLEASHLQAQVDELKLQMKERAAVPVPPTPTPTPPGQPKTLTEKVEAWVMTTLEQRLNTILGGDNGKKAPDEDLVEATIKRLDGDDRLRKRLGMGKTEVVTSTALQPTAGLSPDLLRIVLEDQREQLKIRLADERQKERTEIYDSIHGVIKENLPDAVGALKTLAGRFNSPSGEKRAMIECEGCHGSFPLPAMPGPGERVVCPLCKYEGVVS